MLYEIKALKAPWPAGAKVGDVIDMPYLPAWAEGKCSVALDNAKADFHYEPKTGAGDGLALSLAMVEEVQARAGMVAAEEQARREHEANLQQAVENMRAERDQALQLRAVAQNDLAAALDREAALQQRLDAAQAGPATKTREDLNAEAEKLGVKVDGRWSDERLAEEIAKVGKK